MAGCLVLVDEAFFRHAINQWDGSVDRFSNGLLVPGLGHGCHLLQ